MWHRMSITAAGLLGATAVMVGAYHAHGLEPFLAAKFDPAEVEQRMAWCQTAYQYQLVHAVALIGVGVWLRQGAGTAARIAIAAMFLGTALFCSSLYVLAFTHARVFAHVAPFGGLSLIVGWIAIAVSGARQKSD